MHIDNLLEKLNPYGRYQVTAWIFLAFFNCFPPAWHSFSIVFMGYFPTEFSCLPNNNNNSDYSSTDNYQSNWTKLIASNNDTEQRRCFRPRNQSASEMFQYQDSSSQNETASVVKVEPCPLGSLQYSKNDPIHSSIVTEFDLVCSREPIYVVVSAAEGVGEIIGCIIFGWLADFIGRKRAYFIASATLFTGGMCCSFGGMCWQIVGISRIIIGAGLIGMNNIGYVFASEMFPPKQRTIFSTLHELVWGLGVVSLVGFGYYIRTWREMCFALTLPVILIIPLWWYLQESLHWLLSCSEHLTPEHRRTSHSKNLEQADRIVKWIAKFNKTAQLPADIVANIVNSSKTSAEVNFPLNSEEQTSPKPTEKALKNSTKLVCTQLFATPRVRYITISATFLWFANSLAYYGLQWSAQMLRADFYMSYFLLAIVELPSTLVVLLIMPRIGRRWTIFGFHVIAGICCMTVPFIPDNYSQIAVGIAIFGKFAVCSSFTTLYVFAVELFPTEIRALGFGFSSLLGRIGLVAAPFINWLGVGGVALTSIVRMMLYGVVLLLVALLIIPLPETNNCPLADTIEQTEHFSEYCAAVRKRESEALITSQNDGDESNKNEHQDEN